MKKWAIALLTGILVLSVGVTAWSYEGTGRKIVLKIGDPYMTVNGVRQEVDPGRGTKPVIVSKRTLVPFRVIAENMGGTINWVPERQEVKVIVYDKAVTMTIGSDKAYIEMIAAGSSPASAQRARRLQKLDVPARIVNGRTMVPARFVTESLGAIVGWNEAQKTVTISFDISRVVAKEPQPKGGTAPTTGNTGPAAGSTTPDSWHTAPPQGNNQPVKLPIPHADPHAKLAPGDYADCVKCHAKLP